MKGSSILLPPGWAALFLFYWFLKEKAAPPRIPGDIYGTGRAGEWHAALSV